jgi:hypothetical protein
VCVCDSAGDLARSRRVICSCLAFVFVAVVILFPLAMIHVCFFYSLKEVQSYKMLTCGVTIAGGGA